jgi:hypothetical protein
LVDAERVHRAARGDDAFTQIEFFFVHRALSKD